MKAPEVKLDPTTERALELTLRWGLQFEMHRGSDVPTAADIQLCRPCCTFCTVVSIQSALDEFMYCTGWLPCSLNHAISLGISQYATAKKRARRGGTAPA